MNFAAASAGIGLNKGQIPSLQEDWSDPRQRKCIKGPKERQSAPGPGPWYMISLGSLGQSHTQKLTVLYLPSYPHSGLSRAHTAGFFASPKADSSLGPTGRAATHVASQQQGKKYAPAGRLLHAYHAQSIVFLQTHYLNL